jgi:hypothetical protein
MLGTHFYFGSIRNYVIAFGTLFNEIHIARTDAEGEQSNFMRVPLSYSSKDKMLARVIGDPNIDRPTAIVLPRMSFTLVSMNYDGDRKLNTLGRSVYTTTDKNLNKYQYNPVPYNFNFKLNIYVKNAEDGTKIVEQILPFFTPDWTPTIKLIPEMNVVIDTPVILNSIISEDTYDQAFLQRRAIIWTLDFTLKGYLFGPIKEKKIIKFANTTFYIAKQEDLYDAVGNTAPSDRVTVRPAMLANGSPTTNAAASVPLSEIEADDDFGYAVNIELLLMSNT